MKKYHSDAQATDHKKPNKARLLAPDIFANVDEGLGKEKG